MESATSNELEVSVHSKTNENYNTEAAAAESPVGSKKQRNRKRKLLKDIREQMEFYFSDSNLNKDKYLKEKLKESSDGFIPLSVFAKFNKIKALTTDVSVIALALQASSFLEVNLEHKVKRISEVKELTNADNCTVYVENLPKHVTHDWVKHMFKRCGNVTYVSLPKYKKTGDFKGFGFVEFSCPEAVTKACMELNMPSTSRDDADLYSEHSTDDEELHETHESHLNHGHHSYKSNMMDKKQDCKDRTVNGPVLGNHKGHHHSHSVHHERSSKDKNKAEIHHSRDRRCDHHHVHGKEKRHTDNESTKKDHTEVAELPVSLTKRKVDEDGDTNVTKTLLKKLKTDHDDKLQTKEPQQVHETVGTSMKLCDSNDIDVVGPKPKRKPMRKRRRNRRDNVASLHPLRVMPKKQWLELKAQYRAIQKAHVAAIKKSLLLTEVSSSSMVQKNLPVNEDKVKTLKENQTHECKETVVPGVIIKLCSKEPVSNVRELKDKLKETGYVAYLDLKDGDTDGFIRGKNAESAEKLLKAEVLKMFDRRILSGEAEKEYWRRIEEDRKKKYAKKGKKRGKIKVVDKINKLAQEKNKHVFFD